MTISKTKRALLGATLTAATILGGAILPTQAFAAETAPATAEYQVATTTNGVIKLAVKAFEAGDYAKAVSLNKTAVKSRLSKRKAAIAQTNLCASLAMMDETQAAKAACDTALELRPNYGPALANRELLQVKLAQK